MRRAETFAASEGVERAVEGYDAVLDDPSIDAVYVALPNSLHAEWTIRAMDANKVVLCEKPLCVSEAETETVLRVAHESRALLWEAFVFPFRRHFHRLREIVTGGDIGDLLSIESNFHFQLQGRANIRLMPELGGGALNDVGCYCIHLATLLFGRPPARGTALAQRAAEGVDEEIAGVLDFVDASTLIFSCGMSREQDTFCRIICSEGEVRLSNPFHPSPDDALEILCGGETSVEHPSGPEPSFTAAIQHIHAVLREQEPPRHLATVDSLPTARGLQFARDASLGRTPARELA